VLTRTSEPESAFNVRRDFEAPGVSIDERGLGFDFDDSLPRSIPPNFRRRPDNAECRACQPQANDANGALDLQAQESRGWIRGIATVRTGEA